MIRSVNEMAFAIGKQKTELTGLVDWLGPSQATAVQEQVPQGGG